jgi:hypothetical protein
VLKLSVHFVNVALNRCRVYTQILQVIPQRLSGGNGVDGGEPHDDLAHERGIFYAIKNVVLTDSQLGGLVLKLGFFSPNAIFRVVSCLYIGAI